MKGEKFYIAKRYDRIDCALAKYLNSHGDKLKINFIRESDGVYRFGTRRVVLTLEKGDECHIRVGGGFMHVKQFIEQYTKAEVEKIERTNALIDFQGSRSQVMFTHRVMTNDRSTKSIERNGAAAATPNRKKALSKSPT